MKEQDLLRQIIDGCDEALLDAFLRRMDAALRIASARLQSGEPIWNPDEEQYMLNRVTAGLSPELSRKAYVLWKDLTRMSRGRQYRFFVEHNKSLVLNHEPDIVPELGDGPVSCPAHIARTVSSVLDREATACASISAALDDLTSGRTPFAAVSIDSLYDTEWLYTMIHNKPVYVNSITRTPKGPMIVLLSRHLVNRAEVPIVSVVFSTAAYEHGSLAQAISVLSDNQLNIEYLRLKKHPTESDPDGLLIFLDFYGNLLDVATRASIFQMQSELPFFRLFGYRESV